MVANVGVAVEIVSPAHFVQWLFQLPVSVAAILNSIVGKRREMSGNVDSVICKSDLVENVETASLFQAVQKLLPLPCLRPPSWIFGFLSGMALLKSS